MKKEFWLFVFIIALSTDIGFILSEQNSLRLISKPLIVVSLLIYFISTTFSNASRISNLLISALVFSLAGDILLLFESDSQVFFITGLAAFLLAHIFYIIAFNLLRVREGKKFRVVLLLPVMVYYFLLIFILYSYLQDMKLPVMIYGLTISVMLVMAMHLTRIKDSSFGRIVFLGALLFIISDSILAFNKFYRPWDAGSIMIMLSYGLAQLFIVFGMSRIVGTATQGKTIFAHPQKT